MCPPQGGSRLKVEAEEFEGHQQVVVGRIRVNFLQDWKNGWYLEIWLFKDIKLHFCPEAKDYCPCKLMPHVSTYSSYNTRQRFKKFSIAVTLVNQTYRFKDFNGLMACIFFFKSILEKIKTLLNPFYALLEQSIDKICVKISNQIVLLAEGYIYILVRRLLFDRWMIRTLKYLLYWYTPLYHWLLQNTGVQQVHTKIFVIIIVVYNVYCNLI